jgi:hypothetical protein
MAGNKHLICLRDQAQPLREIGATGNSAKCCQDLFADAASSFLEESRPREA